MKGHVLGADPVLKPTVELTRITWGTLIHTFPVAMAGKIRGAHANGKEPQSPHGAGVGSAFNRDPPGSGSLTQAPAHGRCPSGPHQGSGSPVPVKMSLRVMALWALMISLAGNNAPASTAADPGVYRVGHPFELADGHRSVMSLATMKSTGPPPDPGFDICLVAFGFNDFLDDCLTH